MDIVAIRTTEEFLNQNKQNTARIYLHTGKEYETRSIYKIIQPSVSNFEPLIIVDATPDGEDLAIIPLSSINHILVKGPAKDNKIGFFIEKTQ